VIAISARNFLMHDEFWPRSSGGEYQTYENKEFAYDRMKMAGAVIENELRTIRDPTDWKQKLAHSKCEPWLLGLFQSACSVIDQGRRTITDAGLLMGLRLEESTTPAPDLFHAMNLAMHDSTNESQDERTGSENPPE
jgi:hypothetical protein